MNPQDIGKRHAPYQMDPHSPYLKDFDQRAWSELSKGYEEGRIGNPQLKTAAAEEILDDKDAFRRVAFAFQRVMTAARWHSMTCIEKAAAVRKIAHKPLLESWGLDKQRVRDGEAFMVYKIDRSNNNSKFYEGLIVEQGSTGNFQVLRRWGALTDSGQTGRVDGAKFDNDPRFTFDSKQMAMRELDKHYATRVAHGYIDAFGPNHQTADGHKLPMGQYPVGLNRKPGFGWGTQSVTQCIPALHTLVGILGDAVAAAEAHNARAEQVVGEMENATAILRDVASADSTMARKIMDLMARPIRRLRSGEGSRFLPDPEGAALGRELRSIINYVTKQLSYCA